MRAPRDANAFGFADAPGPADCLTRESCGKKDCEDTRDTPEGSEAAYLPMTTSGQRSDHAEGSRSDRAALTFWCDGSQIIAHRGGQRQTLGPVATSMLLDMLRRDWAA